MAVAPNNDGVLLRRLVDLRRPVSAAQVTVNGASAGTWLSADRAWQHLDSHWQARRPPGREIASMILYVFPTFHIHVQGRAYT